MYRFRTTVLGLLLTLLIGCSTFNYTDPTVTLASIKVLPGEGVAPRFEILLNVINPNDFPLELEGVVWTLDIEGRRVITGVGNSLPVIAAYGEGQVALNAVPDIFNATRVIIELAQQNNANVNYTLDVTLDPTGLKPKIHVKENGSFSLNTLLRP